jgi:erythritol/L-threitol dehydrogenase
MQKTMKALLMYAPYDFRYEEVPVPAVSGKEVLIKVLGCGICAGDIKTFHGGKRVWGESKETAYIEAPVIGGHEFYGEVVEIGENVKTIKIGDLVTSEQIVPCGKCKFCLEGNYQVCTRHYIYGFKKESQGGFAEFMKFNEDGINYVLPPEMPVEQAVLIEPYACGMHAVARAEIEHRSVVVISGLGAIGLSMVSAAKLLQPKLIIGLDLRRNRLDKAISFGADFVFNPLEDNISEEISKLTKGVGCDIYIEATGNEKSVSQGLNITRSLGRYVQFGVFPDKIPADWNIIGDTKELEIRGSHLGPYCYPAVIEGMKTGMLSTQGVVSHKFRLSDWEKAFNVAEKDPDAFKVVLIP